MPRVRVALPLALAVAAGRRTRSLIIVARRETVFTLLVRPRAGSPGVLDFFVDRSAAGEPDEPAYAAFKVRSSSPTSPLRLGAPSLTLSPLQDSSTDTVTLYDAPTSALLGRTRTAPPAVPNAAADRRHRLVELESPAAEVHLRNKPGLTWCWDMEWEGARFTWARDVAGLLGGERGYTLSAVRRFSSLSSPRSLLYRGDS